MSPERAATAWAWAAPSARGAALLQSHGACDFRSTAHEAPKLLRDVLSDANRKRFGAAALLRSANARQHLQVAHPAYHVLSEGNPEERRPLRELVAAMRHTAVGNASMAFDSTSGVVDAKLAAELERISPVPMGRGGVLIFSLGADGTGLGFHTHGATLLGLMHGHKLWLAVRNGTRLPQSWLDPVQAHGYALLAAIEATPAQHAPPVQYCLQPPGSAVYLPERWWHATINLGDAVGAALQQPLTEAILDGVDDAVAAPASHAPDELIAMGGVLLGRGQKLDAAVTLLRAAIKADGRDLRAYFQLAEALARNGDVLASIEVMNSAAAAARTMAAQAEPAVPQLAAMWLLRVGMTLCGPLQEVLAGAEVLREAATHDADALARHSERTLGERCLACAEDEQAC